MSAYFNLGSELTTVDAAFSAVLGEPTIVLRCWKGTYPLMALHLSPDMADRLINSLRESLESMPKTEMPA